MAVAYDIVSLCFYYYDALLQPLYLHYCAQAVVSSH